MIGLHAYPHRSELATDLSADVAADQYQLCSTPATGSTPNQHSGMEAKLLLPFPLPCLTEPPQPSTSSCEGYCLLKILVKWLGVVRSLLTNGGCVENDIDSSSISLSVLRSSSKTSFIPVSFVPPATSIGHNSC